VPARKQLVARRDRAKWVSFAKTSSAEEHLTVHRSKIPILVGGGAVGRPACSCRRPCTAGPDSRWRNKRLQIEQPRRVGDREPVPADQRDQCRRRVDARPQYLGKRLARLDALAAPEDLLAPLLEPRVEQDRMVAVGAPVADEDARRAQRLRNALTAAAGCPRGPPRAPAARPPA
jgi:hypothetical protein